MDQAYERWFQMLNLESPADPGAIVAFEVEAGFALPSGYAHFLKKSNGGWGEIGEHYAQLWGVEELLKMNAGYQVEEYAPGLFLFGSDGGGEAFAFDRQRPGLPIVMVPFIPLRRDEAVDIAPTFDEFLERLFHDPDLLGPVSAEDDLEDAPEELADVPPYEPGKLGLWTLANVSVYVDQCQGRFEAAQAELEKAYGIGTFDGYLYDPAAERLELLTGDTVKLSFEVLPIGSWSKPALTWCWAWDDSALPEALARKLAPLASLAQDDQWIFYDRSQYKARSEDAWFMAALALDRLGGLGIYCCPEEPRLFLLLTALTEDNR